MDLGTGDGRAVLDRAAGDPASLVIGVDASASAMAEASRRADRSRIGNVLFLAAGAEDLPCSPLAGVADLVTVTFPWGSLLRGVLGLDAMALAGVASVVRPDGRVAVLASVVPADRVAGLAGLAAGAEPAIAAAWRSVGLRLDAMCRPTPVDVAATRSTWARRLAAGTGRADRPVWRLAGTREGDRALRPDGKMRRWDTSSSSD